MTTKKSMIPWYWYSIPLMFIIAVVVFLSTKDCYQQYCATGWDVLKLQWPNFWFFAIGGLIAAGILFYLAYISEKAGGSTGRTILFVILALIFLTGPWGKACTDKANGGVTAPGYKSQPAP